MRTVPKHAGHSHAHGHGHDERPFGERLGALASRRALLGSVAVIALLTVVGLVALWPGDVEPVTTLEGESYFGERVEATIEQVTTGDCSYSAAPGDFRCDTVSFVVTSGSPAGDRRQRGRRRQR